MIREYTEDDFGELLRLRCLLYTDYSETEMREEIDAFLHHPHDNRFRNYDLWTSFVHPREDGRLGGFIDVGFVCAADYLERLPHFVGTEYHAQVAQRLSEGMGIPVVESWYVDEDVRGQHVGIQLMQQAEQWVKDHGCSFILSDTDNFRDVSKKAHASFGYDNYYVDQDGCHYFYKRIP